MKQTNYFHRRSNARKPLRISAEAVTLAIAASIVALLVGLVLFIWATENPADPILTVSSGGIYAEQGAYYVPFTVTNVGGGTAETVEIVAELQRDSQVIETGQQQIDFLSSQEEESGVFIFKHDPQKAELSIRASGYKLP
jgi:uncharacterized protein (TIGR02588 family)